MNKFKSILVKSSALVMLLALLSLNLNVNSFPDIDWDQLGISVETESAHAQCPTCPDPDEMKMIIAFCDTGHAYEKCAEEGDGCDVSEQTTCPEEN